MGEDDEEEEDDFINNHDLIGVDGIIEEQKNEINKKKVSIATLSETNQIDSLNCGSTMKSTSEPTLNLQASSTTSFSKYLTRSLKKRYLSSLVNSSIEQSYAML